MFIRGKDRAREVCKRVNPNNRQNKINVFSRKGRSFLPRRLLRRGNILSIFENDKPGAAELIQRQLVIVNPIRRKLKSLPQSRFDRKIWDSFSIVSVWCSLLLGSLHDLWNTMHFQYKSKPMLQAFPCCFHWKYLVQRLCKFYLKFTDSRVTQRARIFRPQSIRDQ